jgi:hypothetical protein
MASATEARQEGFKAECNELTYTLRYNFLLGAGINDSGPFLFIRVTNPRMLPERVVIIDA